MGLISPSWYAAVGDDGAPTRDWLDEKSLDSKPWPGEDDVSAMSTRRGAGSERRCGR